MSHLVVHFSISHELDAPLDALELAILSPDLGPLLGDAMESLASVETRTHEVDGDRFHRVWRFQARAPLKALRGFSVTKEMMVWDERWTYRRSHHEATWSIWPRPDVEAEAPWRRHFQAEGKYHLDPLSDGRTRRTVSGDLKVALKVVGPLVERMALKELKRAYAEEAKLLLELCSHH